MFAFYLFHGNAREGAPLIRNERCFSVSVFWFGIPGKALLFRFHISCSFMNSGEIGVLVGVQLSELLFTEMDGA
jgi:hypothetical protein